MQSRSLFSSLAVHAVAVVAAALLLSSPAVREWAGSVTLVVPVDPDALRVSLRSGGGGGGGLEVLPPSHGRPPRFEVIPRAPASTHQFETPRLAVPPALQGEPERALVRLDIDLGSPWGAVGPPSDGPGSASGIGGGDAAGIGNDDGPGLGPGQGGGVSGLYRLGEPGVTRPRLIRRVEPDYSEQARKAKWQGRVVLSIEVWPDGRAHNIRIVEPLGLGLDEQAVKAVRQWLFEPGLRHGTAVRVQARVEVSFRLL